jgi:hypothetical protein
MIFWIVDQVFYDLFALVPDDGYCAESNQEELDPKIISIPQNQGCVGLCLKTGKRVNLPMTLHCENQSLPARIFSSLCVPVSFENSEETVTILQAVNKKSSTSTTTCFSDSNISFSEDDEEILETFSMHLSMALKSRRSGLLMIRNCSTGSEVCNPFFSNHRSNSCMIEPFDKKNLEIEIDSGKKNEMPSLSLPHTPVNSLPTLLSTTNASLASKKFDAFRGAPHHESVQSLYGRRPRRSDTPYSSSSISSFSLMSVQQNSRSHVLDSSLMTPSNINSNASPQKVGEAKYCIASPVSSFAVFFKPQ